MGLKLDNIIKSIKIKDILALKPHGLIEKNAFIFVCVCVYVYTIIFSLEDDAKKCLGKVVLNIKNILFLRISDGIEM